MQTIINIYHGFDYRTAGDWNPETQSEVNVQTFETLPFLSFTSGWEAADGYRFAYSYIGTSEDLGAIYRENNRVDGSDLEVLPETSRSLSVGDIVSVKGGLFAVMPLGWHELSHKDAEAFYAKVVG